MVSQLNTGARIPSTCVGRSPAALPDLGRAQRAGGERAKGRLCNDSISRGHQTLRITPRQHLSLPVVTIAMWHDGVVVVHLSLPQLPLVSDASRPPQGRDGPSVHPTEKTPTSVCVREREYREGGGCTLDSSDLRTGSGELLSSEPPVPLGGREPLTELSVSNIQPPLSASNQGVRFGLLFVGRYKSI